MKARVVGLSLRSRLTGSANPLGRIIVRSLLDAIADAVADVVLSRLRMPSRPARSRRSTYVAPADALLARVLR